ncbi:glycosyltransferase [Duganella fentianensis]|uniref:glycosyltransferase n=1 Tax=Duganella fentianensis TaxID=2692177 RepID=UPI0032B2D642
MIFVTVGSQMAFDRLIRAVDRWAGTTPGVPHVLAQIGPSTLVPTHVESRQALSPAEFNAAVARADVIVAHAGMGSVLTAMELGKPLVLMPRRGDLQETRNDHQVATAKWLSKRAGIYVAMDEHDLPTALADALASAQGTATIAPYATPQLLDALRQFIGAA